MFIDFLLSFCLPVILSFSHEMSSEKKSSKTPRPLPSSDEESEDLQFSLASEEVSTYIKKKFWEIYFILHFNHIHSFLLKSESEAEVAEERQSRPAVSAQAVSGKPLTPDP